MRLHPRWRSSCLLFVAFLVTSISAQWFEKTILLPDSLGYLSGPGSVVQNPVSGRMYVTSSPGILMFDPVTLEKKSLLPRYGDPVLCPEVGKAYLPGDSLRLLDLATDSIIATIPFLFTPGWVIYTPTSRKLYMGMGGSGSGMASFDVNGDTFLREFGQDSWCFRPAWDPVHNRLFVPYSTRTQDYWLGVVDCAADTFVGHLPLGDVQSLVACGDGEVYCNLGDSVVVVDGGSLSVIGRIPGVPEPDTMVYCELTNRVYMPRFNLVSIVDCTADTVRAEVGLTEEVRDGRLKCSEATGKAYALLNTTPTVAVIDTFDQVSATISRPGITLFDELGFAGNWDDLFLAMSSDTVLRVDARADTVSGILPYVYFRASGLMHNPAGNKLYVHCYNKDVFLVLDSDHQVVCEIPAGPLSNEPFMMLDHELNRLYVVDDGRFLVIDCNADQVVDTEDLPGFDEAVLVRPAGCSRLYIFPRNVVEQADTLIWVYDCYRDSMVASVRVPDEAPAAVYHPASGLIYFCCKDTPSVRILDPTLNQVVGEIAAGANPNAGRMAVDLDLGRVYFTNDRSSRMYVIDVGTNSVAGSMPVTPRDVDTLYWNRAQQKLYLVCYRSEEGIYVFDTRLDTIVGHIGLNCRDIGLYNARNDKLYLGDRDLDVAVVDCRYDSVVARFEGASRPRVMAWNAIDNRVYVTRRRADIWVYRDDPVGVEEKPEGAELRVERKTPTIVRGVLNLAEDGTRSEFGANSVMSLVDITGRKVMDLKPGENDVRHLAPGVYFVTPSPQPSPPEGERTKERGLRSAVGGKRSAVRKVIVNP